MEEGGRWATYHHTPAASNTRVRARAARGSGTCLSFADAGRRDASFSLAFRLGKWENRDRKTMREKTKGCSDISVSRAQSMAAAHRAAVPPPIQPRSLLFCRKDRFACLPASGLLPRAVCTSGVDDLFVLGYCTFVTLCPIASGRRSKQVKSMCMQSRWRNTTRQHARSLGLHASQAVWILARAERAGGGEALVVFRMVVIIILP